MFFLSFGGSFIKDSIFPMANTIYSVSIAESLTSEYIKYLKGFLI